jgi:hypothetical protein
LALGSALAAQAASAITKVCPVVNGGNHILRSIPNRRLNGQNDGSKKNTGTFSG